MQLPSRLNVVWIPTIFVVGLLAGWFGGSSMKFPSDMKQHNPNTTAKNSITPSCDYPSNSSILPPLRILKPRPWLVRDKLIALNDVFFRDLDSTIVVIGGHWTLREDETLSPLYTNVNTSSRKVQIAPTLSFSLKHKAVGEHQQPTTLNVPVRWITNGRYDEEDLMVGYLEHESLRTVNETELTVRSTLWGEYRVTLERTPAIRVDAHEHAPRKQARYRIGAHTMFKNDNHFLEMWMAYHAHIGFDTFLLYNNNPRNMSHIEELSKRFHIVLLEWSFPKYHEFGGQTPEGHFPRHQVVAQNHALHCFPELQWIQFSDLDEFLVPMQVDRIDVLLDALPKQVAAVTGTNVFFGCPHPGVTYNRTNYIEKFTRRSVRFSLARMKTIAMVGLLLSYR
jgi:hypothetical protein